MLRLIVVRLLAAIPVLFVVSLISFGLTLLVPAVAPTIKRDYGKGYGDGEMSAGGLVPVAFSAKDHGHDALTDCSPTLRAGGHNTSHRNGGVMPAVAFMENVRAELRTSDQTDALTRGGGKHGQGYAAAMVGMQVRRLTPRECERLQGFPDDYTLIPVRGKPAADGPRYKALGNSMAVPVMNWIGRRIAFVDAISTSTEFA